MRHYRQNARWLLLFAPFRGMVLSAAYLGFWLSALYYQYQAMGIPVAIFGAPT
jgi:hypothetical protein